MSDIKTWLWLTLSEGITGIKITSLFERFHSAEEIYKAEDKAYVGIHGITKNDISTLSNKDTSLAEKVMLTCKQKGIRIMTHDSAYYPQNLMHIYDTPYVLYVRSKERIDLNKHLMISVVGNRRVTPYGRTVTTDFCTELSKQGVTIVSGMARGVDGLAHAAALSVGGVTIAVLGCGVDVVYPPEHKQMMEQIACVGMVISEYPPGTPPLAEHFPRRNRIISGISAATLVTEAPIRSGSLITASCALEQNREIFAVPGNITSKQSSGTNSLIRASGAKAVLCAEDILEEFRDAYMDVLEMNRTSKDEEDEINTELALDTGGLSDEVFASLTEQQKIIIMHMSVVPSHIDNIMELAKIPADELSAALTILEISGLIKSYPGKMFGLST